ncbi:hypothetical protein KY495_08900 [Massilia sp. PAMC28688]|uniref:hypothetical protein n=1 Tax=Massilia sp. PAMC28688 TaxID=2861283 RepID=UPI001C6262D4|nr:hypothetical protein [Massilia sp. PAMC28688]QYF95251.1 hypothetical protein KY495_08900 [Massilia sp. PAMC28688]
MLIIQWLLKKKDGLWMNFFVSLLAVLLTSSAFAAEPAQTRLIGFYTNMVTEGKDDPHFLAGYNISLYSKGERTLVHIGVANGSTEPVSAAVKSVAYDPVTRRLKFCAVYSTGLEHGPGQGAPREALRTLTFSGIVHPNSIKGTMAIRDVCCAGCRTSYSRAKLKRIKHAGRTGELIEYPLKDGGQSGALRGSSCKIESSTL